MRRETLKQLLVVIVIFAIFLPLYYLFSYGSGDGLESTLEHGNATGTDDSYNAPLSYGENFLESLVLGIIGIIIVFVVFYALFLVVRRKKGDE